MDFLIDAFTNPESQADFYAWSSVLLAHFGLGVCTYCLFFVNSIRVKWVIPSLIWVAWELLQLFYGATFDDLLVDLTAELSGVFVADALWTGNSILGRAMIVLVFSVWLRRKRNGTDT